MNFNTDFEFPDFSDPEYNDLAEKYFNPDQLFEESYNFLGKPKNLSVFSNKDTSAINNKEKKKKRKKISNNPYEDENFNDSKDLHYQYTSPLQKPFFQNNLSTSQEDEFFNFPTQNETGSLPKIKIDKEDEQYFNPFGDENDTGLSFSGGLEGGSGLPNIDQIEQEEEVEIIPKIKKENFSNDGCINSQLSEYRINQQQIYQKQMSLRNNISNSNNEIFFSPQQQQDNNWTMFQNLKKQQELMGGNFLLQHDENAMEDEGEEKYVTNRITSPDPDGLFAFSKERQESERKKYDILSFIISPSTKNRRGKNHIFTDTSKQHVPVIKKDKNIRFVIVFQKTSLFGRCRDVKFLPAADNLYSSQDENLMMDEMSQNKHPLLKGGVLYLQMDTMSHRTGRKTEWVSIPRHRWSVVEVTSPNFEQIDREKVACSFELRFPNSQRKMKIKTNKNTYKFRIVISVLGPNNRVKICSLFFVYKIDSNGKKEKQTVNALVTSRNHKLGKFVYEVTNKDNTTTELEHNTLLHTHFSETKDDGVFSLVKLY